MINLRDALSRKGYTKCETAKILGINNKSYTSFKRSPELIEPGMTIRISYLEGVFIDNTFIK